VKGNLLECFNPFHPSFTALDLTSKYDPKFATVMTSKFLRQKATQKQISKIVNRFIQMQDRKVCHLQPWLESFPFLDWL